MTKSGSNTETTSPKGDEIASLPSRPDSPRVAFCRGLGPFPFTEAALLLTDGLNERKLQTAWSPRSVYQANCLCRDAVCVPGSQDGGPSRCTRKQHE